MAELVEIEQEIHSGKYWQKPGDYFFAARWKTVPLLITELARAVAHMPVGFERDAEGRLETVGLLGAQGRSNRFVTPEGAWKCPFKPSILQVHPFRVARVEGKGDLPCMDLASGLITDGPPGEPLFTSSGSPGEGFREVLGLLMQREKDRSETLVACAALDQAGIIVPWNLRPGHDPAFQGLCRVDDQALNRLSHEELLRLHKGGAMFAAYAHLFSREHLNEQPARRFVAAKKQKPGQNMQVKTKSSRKVPDMNYIKKKVQKDVQNHQADLNKILRSSQEELFSFEEDS